MDDLLKEAIADAKAVRETALENAKMALEEAFTPKLQSMLSQKIQTEMEDEAEEEFEAEDEDEEEFEEEDEEFEAEEAEDEEAEMEEEGIIEIDGVKYAPVVSEEEEEADEAEEEFEDAGEEEDELDLESVIKELEDELEDSDDEEEVTEEADEADEEELEIDEELDLEEVLKALTEEEDEEEEMDEVAQLKSDLDEHRSVVQTLREKLNEVNLLNAKLLFTNKLFRKFGLNNEQKMKVVEQFDRAHSLREVKLVYSTLGESFGNVRNEINESRGAASKPVASTKSEKEVITESSDLRDRFKKLANLI